MTANNIDELWFLLRERLAASRYANSYDTEINFEQEVWTRVVALAQDLGVGDLSGACLTSHAIHENRSEEAWRSFCREPHGPDVNILGSNNRLDIVFRHEVGSIGIEVKWLGQRGHAAKLTQGLGQVLLGLEHRDRTILVIHCGTVGVNERERLREVGNRVCAGSRTALVVVP